MPLQKHLPLQDYCKQLTDLFQQAISQPDPALFLHQKNARTPLFMAESLTRVLCEAKHKKKTEKALKLFKKLEDALGKIEENDTLIKHFSKHKTIKQETLNYFMIKRLNAIEKLNGKLIKKEFYQDDFNKIARKLEVNFNDKALVKRLQKQINAEIDHCFHFFAGFDNGFTEMEPQVHEIRRKLRWISIYAQSFKGVMKLEHVKTKYEWEEKFSSAASSKSSYNEVAINKKLTAHIKLNQKAFYALNFVVAALGKIKDKGLELEALQKAIRKTSDFSNEAAQALALEQLNLKMTEPGLLQEAHELLKEFFDTYGIHKLLM